MTGKTLQAAPEPIDLPWRQVAVLQASLELSFDLAGGAIVTAAVAEDAGAMLCVWAGPAPRGAPHVTITATRGPRPPAGQWDDDPDEQLHVDLAGHVVVGWRRSGPRTWEPLPRRPDGGGRRV